MKLENFQFFVERICTFASVFEYYYFECSVLESLELILRLCLDPITCLIKKMSSKKGMVYCLEYMNVCLVSELAEYSNCSVEFHLDM